jgi:hypothetical protein
MRLHINALLVISSGHSSSPARQYAEYMYELYILTPRTARPTLNTSSRAAYHGRHQRIMWITPLCVFDNHHVYRTNGAVRPTNEAVRLFNTNGATQHSAYVTRHRINAPKPAKHRKYCDASPLRTTQRTNAIKASQVLRRPPFWSMWGYTTPRMKTLLVSRKFSRFIK